MINNSKVDSTNIKDKNLTLIIILISIIIFGAYILKLNVIIEKQQSIEFIRSEFIRFFNALLCILAILSCLITYKNNRKKELFLMCLVYIIFFIDIIFSNLSSYKSNEVSSYVGIASTFLRLSISFIAISDLEKIKNIISKDIINTLCIVIVISLMLIKYEYMCIDYNENLYIFYNLFSFFSYLFIAITFFRKSILENEYIYGLLATSILMFATKSIYAIASYFYLNEVIKLTSVSITYIGFIILISGLFIELSKTITKNKVLENQKDLFLNIVEESKYSNIIICDKKYDILYFNKNSISNVKKYLLNIENENKFNFKDTITVKDLFKEMIEYKEIDNSLENNGYYNKEVYIEEKDIFLDISIQLFKKDNLIYKVVFFKNITEKYKMQEAILENKSMKNEEIMKSEFFANISHELKTPLNIIYSTTQLLNYSLDKDNFKDTYINHKNSLDINCKRIIRLIDNIVDITKLNVGFKKPVFINYDIIKLIEDVTMSTVNYAIVKDIEIIFDTEIEELNMKCDPYLLERILLNLLSNSIKYTNRYGHILVYLSINMDFLSIKVKDDGIGIPDYIQDRIYERFVQGDKSFTRQNEGSGIGLSLVKSIVELIDGQINFKSNKENGTEFEILLPIELLEEENEECSIENYHNIDVQRIQLEFSDIYDIYI